MEDNLLNSCCFLAITIVSFAVGCSPNKANKNQILADAVDGSNSYEPVKSLIPTDKLSKQFDLFADNISTQLYSPQNHAVNT